MTLASDIAADPGAPSGRFDPVLYEVMKGEFMTIVDEMCAVIGRTARSFGAREGGDYSGSVIHPDGQVLARSGISVWYVGNSIPFIIDKFAGRLKDGDIVIHNDPYSGGTHLPDLVLVAPVFAGERLIGYVGNAVHHSDIGGFALGGMSTAPSELFQEGLLLPRVLLYDGGKPVEQVFEILRANTRAPDDVLGDLDGQIAGCFSAAADLKRMAAKYGVDNVLSYGERLVADTEQAVRNAIATIPDGSYRAETEIRCDDATPIRIVLSLEIDGDAMTVDFTGSSPQSSRALNVPPSTLAGNLLRDFHKIFDIDAPGNSGLISPIRIVAPPGTAVNPRFPAAVGARSNICNKLSDLLFEALAQAMPERLRAEGPTSQILLYTPDSADGTSGHMLFDLWIGGTGARARLDGSDGPIGFRRISAEMMERDFPVALDGFGMVPDTGGAGRLRGGLSIFRQHRFLAPGKLTIRNLYPGKNSPGLAGGLAGSPCVLRAVIGGETRDFSDVNDAELRVEPGDTVYQECGGGAGQGDPLDRDLAAVTLDLSEGKVTVAQAEAAYGVVCGRDGRIDEPATELLRRQRRSRRWS